MTKLIVNQPAVQPDRLFRLRMNPSTVAALGYGWVAAVLFLVLVCAGCHRKNAVGIDVDLYLHPEAADSEDLLLQTAIQSQLDKDSVTHYSLIHVRVVDKLVFLDGSVDTQKEKDQAETVARNTTVAVNGITIRAAEVRTHIELQP